LMQNRQLIGRPCSRPAADGFSHCSLDPYDEQNHASCQSCEPLFGPPRRCARSSWPRRRRCCRAGWATARPGCPQCWPPTGARPPGEVTCRLWMRISVFDAWCFTVSCLHRPRMYLPQHAVLLGGDASLEIPKFKTPPVQGACCAACCAAGRAAQQAGPRHRSVHRAPGVDPRALVPVPDHTPSCEVKSPVTLRGTAGVHT
jgi:hypothetical protein